MSDERTPSLDDDVRHAGWARHETEQRARWARLTPHERLLWLEEAQRFQHALKHPQP